MVLNYARNLVKGKFKHEQTAKGERKGPRGNRGKDGMVAHDEATVNTMRVTPLQLVHLLCGFNMKHPWK